jgi:signal transduction histidine kinase
MDITRRKRDEEELRHLVEALGRANRLKSEFVAAISHELRTPLNIVLGYSEILLMEELGSLTAEQRHSLEQMEHSANELLGLINQMLDLNRLDSGRLSIVNGIVHPRALFAELRAELVELTAKPGITVAWEASDSVPALDTDGAKLKVILKNLIGNAVKFTDAGEVRVVARALGIGVELAVSDTGIGVAPETLPIIFEPFRQVDGSMTRRHGGVGLGLHLVQRLLEVLGGTIAVQSVPGVGSTFRVWLPCRR